MFEILAIGEEKPDFVSARIQNFLGTDYSHVAVLVDGYLLYHATGEGFHAEPLDAIMAGHVIRHRIKVEVPDVSYARGWLDGCIGTEYSQSQYLGFFLPPLRRFLNNGTKRTICSEAVADFLFECCRLNDPRLFTRDFLSPRDIVEIARGQRA